MNRLYIILGICLFAFAACQEDGAKPCSETKPAAAIINDFPDSLKVGVSVEINIQYVLENSCGNFDRFDITSSNKNFEVKLITKYEGCNCNLEFKEADRNFEIQVDFPGVYTYNFWQADGDFDVRSIKIYE